MAVRVKVRLEFAGEYIEAVAIANSGYEATTPEILIPENLARLRWRRILKGAPYVEYATAGGHARFKCVGEAKVSITCKDRISKKVRVRLLVSGIQRGVLLNDKLCGRLGMVLVDPATGRWRFRDDPPNRQRRSQAQQMW